jgi:hypothetical protein
MKEASEIGDDGEPVAKCSEGRFSTPGIEVRLNEESDTTKIGPHISLKLPYELWAEDYEGEGLFIVELKDVLEDFLKNYWYDSHGDDTQSTIDMLRHYADKLEENIKLRSQEGMSKSDEEYADFIGSTAFEDDAGWSKQVWNAAWHACLMYIIERSNKDKPVEKND